jgi:hypothetical protein
MDFGWFHVACVHYQVFAQNIPVWPILSLNATHVFEQIRRALLNKRLDVRVLQRSFNELG